LPFSSIKDEDDDDEEEDEEEDENEDAANPFRCKESSKLGTSKMLGRLVVGRGQDWRMLLDTRSRDLDR
jgi:hypothetical protein